MSKEQLSPEEIKRMLETRLERRQKDTGKGTHTTFDSKGDAFVISQPINDISDILEHIQLNLASQHNLIKMLISAHKDHVKCEKRRQNNEMHQTESNKNDATDH